LPFNNKEERKKEFGSDFEERKKVKTKKYPGYELKSKKELLKDYLEIHFDRREIILEEVK